MPRLAPRTTISGRVVLASGLLCAAALAAAPVAPAAPRGFELVTPADSGPYDAVPIAAGPDGSRFYWGSAGVGDLAGEDGGAAGPDAFISRRTAGGWASEWLSKTAPSDQVDRGTFFPGMTADSLLFLPQANLVPEDQNNVDPFGPSNFDLYRMQATGPTLLSGGGSSAIALPPRGIEYSPDQSIVVFSTPDPLVPDDQDFADDVYQWEAGGVTLLSRQVDGSAENSGIGVWSASPPRSLSRSGGSSTHGLEAMTDDGGTVVMTTDEALDPVADTDGGATDIYLWQDGQVSLISRPSGAGTFDPATFAGMSADGQTIYVSTVEALLPADGDGAEDIYRYEPGADPSDRLTLATPGGSQPAFAVTVAANGTLFFATQDRLGSDPPPPGSAAVIYRAVSGTVETVCEIGVWGLTPDDERQPESSPGSSPADTYPDFFLGLVSIASYTLPGQRPVRATADGETLVFASKAALLPADDDFSSPDIYLWRAGEGLSLVSAGGTGAYPAVLGGSVPPGGEGEAITFGHMGARVITDDGTRVFFTSAEPLTGDAPDNGLPKVYEWADGALALVSPSAAAAGPAVYVDSSTSGDDVFLRTADTLTGWDSDGGQEDIYDARVGGGFPEPPFPSTGGPAPDGSPGAAPPVPGLPSTEPSVEQPPSDPPRPPGDETEDPASLSVDAASVERSGRKLAVSVTASHAGVVRGVLRNADGRALARGRRNVRPARDATLELKLTRAGRELVRAGKPLRGALRVELTTRDGEKAGARAQLNVPTSDSRVAKERR